MWFENIPRFIIILTVLLSIENANTLDKSLIVEGKMHIEESKKIGLSQPWTDILVPSIPEDFVDSPRKDYTHHLQLSPEFQLTWSVNLEYSTISFATIVKGTGWVSVGFSLDGKKPKSDAFIGGVSANGNGYFQDVYFTQAGKLPFKDGKQDWNLIDSSEDNGNTSLVFSRRFITGDYDDINIEDRDIYLIWGFQESIDDAFETFGKHSQVGAVKINFLAPLPTTETPIPTTETPIPTTETPIQSTETPSTTTETPNPSTETTTASEPTTIEFTTITREPTTTKTTTKPPEFDFRKEIEINPDIMVQWFVDLPGQRIQFVLQVRALGWVGFGISDTGKKSHADIILGGIKDGSYYFDDAHFNEDGVVPMWDDQVDWNFVDGFEYDGQTVLEFWREFDTGDINDIVIQYEMIDLIWAFHPSLDTPYEISSRHSSVNRGFYRVNLLDPVTVSDSVIMHHKPTVFFPQI